MRLLKYSYERDADGRKVNGPDGKWIVTERREKGVDMLVRSCARALVREARQPDVDLAILASHESDLDPALDEAAALGSAKELLGEQRTHRPPRRADLPPAARTALRGRQVSAARLSGCVRS